MRFGRLALVLGLGLFVAGMAAAQPPGGGFPGGPGGFGGGFGAGGNLTGMLTTNKQLQDEMKVTKDQVDKLNDALAKVREDLRDDMAKLRDRQTSQDERDKILKKMSDANAKAVAAVLTADQVKRLHQIENQQAGTSLFNKEDIQEALKLTDKQLDEIKSITKDLQKDLREVRGAGGFGFDPEVQKKRQDLQKAALEDMKKLLTAKQKDTLKDLLGEPFELTFAPPAGGFGGFGAFGQPGQILAQFTQDQLKLTAEQKKELAELQKEVDAKLDKLLTEEQRKQLKDMRSPRPFGPPGARPQQ
jgi:Spy/CpxP family protein refolding chaperone